MVLSRLCRGSLRVVPPSIHHSGNINTFRHLHNRDCSNQQLKEQGWPQVFRDNASRYCPYSSRNGDEQVDHETKTITKPDKEQSSAVARNPVLAACVKSTASMTAIGLILRSMAWQISDGWSFIGTTDARVLLSNDFETWHVAVVALIVAVITAGRLILLSAWPEYKTATDSSNKLVLPSLQGQDLFVVSFLPGFSEELLFRGALIPLLGGSWLSVGLSGLGFGALHVGGGRNWAFAAWATVIGMVYGASYVYTRDLLVPALAHSMANYASARIWLQSYK